MAHYNQTTQEIARPSDLLAAIRAYTASVHTLSRYISVDVTRLVKNVLLQQTQPLDSQGSQTITTLYTTWYKLTTPFSWKRVFAVFLTDLSAPALGYPIGRVHA